MKNHLFFKLVAVYLVSSVSFLVYANNSPDEYPANFRILFNGVYYSNDQTAIAPCTSVNYSGGIAVFNPANNTYSIYPGTNNKLEQPQNWNIYASTPSGSLAFYVNSGSGGKIRYQYTYNNEHGQSKFGYLTLNIVQAPTPIFSSVPNLGSNQNGTAVVDVPNNDYNNILWRTTGGLTVNGSSTYNSVTTSAPVATSGFGGKLFAKVSNNCGVSAEDYAVIGTPYISGKWVNNSPSQNFNYVPSYVNLSISTDNTAASATWTIDGGNGSINPSGFSCVAQINQFMRVFVVTSNGSGNGETYMFYLMDENYNGYQFRSSNPTNDEIVVDFEYKEIVNDMLESIVLYNEKGNVMINMLVNDEHIKKEINSSRKFVLNVKPYPQGVYYLHIKIGDRVNKHRFVIK